LARERRDKRDAACFKHEIAPKLDAIPLKQIANATGLSLAAFSRIHAGKKVPHPRHGDMLAVLITLQWVVESRRVGLHEASCRK
jgi:hypothetical protein